MKKNPQTNQPYTVYKEIKTSLDRISNSEISLFSFVNRCILFRQITTIKTKVIRI